MVPGKIWLRISNDHLIELIWEQGSHGIKVGPLRDRSIFIGVRSDGSFLKFLIFFTDNGRFSARGAILPPPHRE